MSVNETDDPVNPNHYTSMGEYSAKHVIRKWGLGFNLGNVLKYIQRHEMKNGIEDLQKAIWYLQDEVRCRLEEELDSQEPFLAEVEKTQWKKGMAW